MSLVISFLLVASGLPTEDAVIRGKTKDSEIVVTATRRCAGAIHSLTWRGKEFIDSYDHGRQMQSASNFDFGSPIINETFNPTEAGSRLDGTGETSTSRLISIQAKGNSLRTRSQMAFWLAPGEFSGENPAKNKTTSSNHFLSKKVTVGVQGRPQLIEHEVTFELPADEIHHQAVFESLTGYMPPEFNTFWTFDAETSGLKPLSDGPGEQPAPVILATALGDFAMGIYSPEPAPKGYGRWRFAAEKVVKWNCVFRVNDPKPGSSYTYRHLIAVGTLEDVRREMAALAK